MNQRTTSVAGPFTHENLSIFLLRGTDALDGSRFIPLDEAMEQKCVIVHETGNVGQLEIENLSEWLDLYVQAGDVVKGGPAGPDARRRFRAAGKIGACAGPLGLRR